MFESRPGDNAWLAGFIKNLKYAFTRRAPGLDKLIELMQPADRIVKKCRQQEKGDQITDLHRACQCCVTAKPENEQCADRFKHRHRRRVNRPDPHDDKCGVPQLVACPIKTPCSSLSRTKLLI